MDQAERHCDGHAEEEASWRIEEREGVAPQRALQLTLRQQDEIEELLHAAGQALRWRVGWGAAITLSMRRPSTSTISKRQPP
jgi:hypothetical protein